VFAIHINHRVTGCAQGSVGPAEVYTFFREIHDMWVKMGEYADLAIYDVVDELIDMVSWRACRSSQQSCQNRSTFLRLGQIIKAK